MSVQYLGETKVFSPQEISAMVLMKVGAGKYGRRAMQADED